MIKERFFDSKALEEYILSACMHNPRHALICTTKLSSERNFHHSSCQKAFGVIETFVDAGQELDSMVIMNRWIDLGIYSEYEARDIFQAAAGDEEFEPKLAELQDISVIRNARNDIQTLNEMTYQDISPDKLIDQAMNLVASWTTGKNKSYQSAREVEEELRNKSIGEKLRQGVPLLDDVLYQYAGQYKGTVKGTILREKHGKTRYATWDACHDLRMGSKVLYITLEGQKGKILDNFEQILQGDFEKYKDNLLIKDTEVDLGSLVNTIVESKYNDGIDKLVFDYLQLAKHERHLYLSDNENINKCCERLTQTCVKYDILGHYLAQSIQEDKQKSKWDNVPGKYSVYGSKQLVKDCSLLQVGIRPSEYEDMIINSPLGNGVEGPEGNREPMNSVFIKTITSREKHPYAHMWMHLVDTDKGMKLHRNELI